MKQKTKYLSKATMSIVLALVLVVSTLAVGIVATNAAYLNGKPNAEANAADVAGDKTADVEDAAVGAKAPEAVGANAGESVGTTGWYVKDKNGNLLGDNIHDEDFSFNITSTMLDGNDVKIKITDENGKEYGNNNSVSKGNTVTASESSIHCVILTNAKNYSNVTLHIKYTGSSGNNTCSVHWKSGVSTAHNVTYNTPENGSLPSNTTANTGDWVQFAATPNPGYQVSTVTYTPSGGSATNCTQVSGNTYKFQMPDKDVAVSATFSKRNYTINKTETNCTVAVNGTARYQDEVSFTVSPTSGYALQTLTVKQGTTNIPYTETSGTYKFTMPAGDVTITATCANTAGTTTVYFKSATAWVYKPLISINGGTEIKMTEDRYLVNSANSYQPKSQTGSLRYAWYKIDLTGVDLTSPVTLLIKGQDTYMEATGTFTLTENGSIYLACDNLMEGKTLVDISSLADGEHNAALDFYDTPLNMIDD